VPTTWLTPADVAAYLGGDVDADDPNLATVVDGIRAYLEGVRSDIFGSPASPIAGEPIVPENLRFGGILWCAHAYQLRSGPSGFAGYGDGAGDAMYDLSMATNRADIWRLTGVKRPVSA
jgi:hypothetical protein